MICKSDFFPDYADERTCFEFQVFPINSAISTDCYDTFTKCPGFYCIPWRYVCDGIWHCPGGTEEDTTYCNDPDCINKFRCRNSSVCLYLSSVCDENGLIECPNGDDEFLCDIEFPACPSNCFCLLFSIICQFEVFTKYNGAFPYVLVSMTNCTFTNKLIMFIHNFENVSILHVPQNNLSVICIDHLIKSKITDIIYTDFYGNNVTEISSGCFKNMPRMFYLNLSWNNVFNIDSTIFSASSSIKYVDLSFNYINNLKRDIFLGISTLILLKLDNNPIMDVSLSVLNNIQHVSIIKATYYKICCFVEQRSCKIRTSWPKSCGRLLENGSCRLIMWLLAVGGLLSNVVTLISTPFIMDITKEAGYNYKSIVMMIAVGDVFSCISLVIIASADMFYKNHYILYESYWRGSVMCYISAVLIFLSNIMSCVSLVFLAISRFSVVKWPLNSHFLEKEFVKKWIVGIIYMSCVMSVTTMLLYRFLSDSKILPTGLCFLLGNIDTSIIPLLVSILILVLQMASTLLLPILYLLLHIEQKTANLLVKSTSSKSGNRKTSVFISLTNLICWIPCCIILIITFVWREYPFSVLIWATSIVLPMNAILNPFSLVYWKHMRKVARMGLNYWKERCYTAPIATFTSHETFYIADALSHIAPQISPFKAQHIIAPGPDVGLISSSSSDKAPIELDKVPTH